MRSNFRYRFETRRRFVLATLLSLISVMPFGAARAQLNYPSRTIRILIGFPPGGTPDVIARVLAEGLSKAWGKSVIVEALTGAAGNLAAERLARSQPDGYTLLLSGDAAIVTNVSLYERLPYDPLNDFAPISQIAIAPNFLVIHPDVPATTLPELVAYARTHPGRLNYGHAGLGTSQHLAGEMFRFMTGAEIQHVPYRGSQGLMPDLLGGRLTMYFGNGPTVLPAVREGRLRALAVTSVTRSRAMPELPTLAESGFPSFDAVAWFGLLAPAGTPRPIVEMLHREVVAVLRVPEVQHRLEQLELDVIASSPGEFSALIAAQIPKRRAVIEAAGVRVQ